jgi:mannose-1-phosphate guanylyltransferase / mannose-6-phosphate isomerase
MDRDARTEDYCRVLAADHVVKDGMRFAKLCAKAALGEIVTFSVKPDHPATGYGYIHPGEPLSVDQQVRRVERFVEKPSEERAQGFIESGHLWNSGNFVFRAAVMLEELARF